MALESALWQRCKKGAGGLRLLGHKVHVERIENAVGVGRPDVNGCVDGGTFDIELKSEERPARPSTKIRFKVRQAQAIWMHERAAAGCKTIWILIQVGSGPTARLYLIPGTRYEDIIATESELQAMSVIEGDELLAGVLLRASQGW